MKSRMTLCAAGLSQLVFVSAIVAQQGAPLLTYRELIQLYKQDVPPRPLQLKLNHLLTTPFVSNQAAAAGRRPLKPVSTEIGKFLRVAQWNIERGLEFDAVMLAFTDPRRFTALMENKGSKASAEERTRIAEQIGILKAADVVVLNEVDWGMNRTLFRNVAAQLASAFGMNYAYGVEFVEVDPITMGLDQRILIREVEQTYAEPGATKAQTIAHIKRVMRPDPARYHGLHGTAILSRYRLENVQLLPFKFQGHDWYLDEKKKESDFAKLQGKASDTLFKEQMIRQVRRGGRMMLLADIVDRELPSGRVTVVATHLEDVTSPKNRRQQLDEMLDRIRNINHPVILAGDMNTSTHDAMPISMSRAIKQRIGSGKWWAEEGATSALKYGTPAGWIYDASFGAIGFARKVDDPTEHSILLLGENAEAKFFVDLDKFRFADGAYFDFRGESERSSNGRGGKLADSNQRGEKGFAPTVELGKTSGPLGQYKLDWIFVRPAAQSGYRFAPHFGRTLKELNFGIPGRISDHSPITADLPFKEPPMAGGKVRTISLAH